MVATVLLTVYGQLVLKWQVGLTQPPPFEWLRVWPGVLQLLFRPWVISAFAAAFAASLCWMFAISALDLSRAYPFMASNFLIVAMVSAPLFGETLTAGRITGLILVVAGLVLVARS